MLVSSMQNQLTQAREHSFEVEVLLDGRTIYPSLIVTDFDDDTCSFVGAEGFTLTILNDKITGVLVHSESPRWWTNQQQGYASNIDVRENANAKTKARETVNA